MFLCFMYFLTLFYFWAIRSHDRQVEINTYLLTQWAIEIGAANMGLP